MCTKVQPNSDLLNHNVCFEVETFLLSHEFQLFRGFLIGTLIDSRGDNVSQVLIVGNHVFVVVIFLKGFLGMMNHKFYLEKQIDSALDFP